MKTAKKGQITVFAILGILLVAAIALVYLLYQDKVDNFGSRQQETTGLLEQCVNEQIGDAVDKIIANTGSIEEISLTKEFQGEEQPYLCYTGLYYSRCTPQNIVLINFLKEDITEFVEPKIDDCFKNLKLDLESKDYEIVLGENQEVNIEILPGKIRTNIVRDLKETKSEQIKTYDSFEFIYQTPLYILNSVTHEIVSQEAILCNSDYVELMRIHPSIEISKFNTGDDVKIYTIKDKDSGKGWKFALRNCVLATPG